MNDKHEKIKEINARLKKLGDKSSWEYEEQIQTLQEQVDDLKEALRIERHFKTELQEQAEKLSEALKIINTIAESTPELGEIHLPDEAMRSDSALTECSHIAQEALQQYGSKKE